MQNYFYGWYFKCQSDTKTLAIIPAVHGAGRERTCSIQLITEDHAWSVEFEGSSFYQKGKKICIEKNLFWEDGIRLKIETSELTVTGALNFGKLTPLKYDIMGPFALVPFMECRHMVWSMCHCVNGEICINGKNYVFKNALGYWEGDRGRSFPKEYAWTQCFFQETIGQSSALQNHSFMLSVADIPLAGGHFTGMIGVIRWKGKEYRLTTYLGAKVLQKSDGKLYIRQGKMELEAELLEKSGQALKAPMNGKMERTIYESAVCKAFYRFRIHGETIFAFETDKASFEWQFTK